jgi:DNA-binding CsgD family transcriptional regulator
MVHEVQPAILHAGILSSPVLVGRRNELALLLNAVMRVPSLVLLEGEAGVGKTRLVQELVISPDLINRRCYIGRCVELSEPFPLGPLVEALRDVILPRSLPPVVGALRPLLPELAAHLPDMPPPLDSRQAERHRLFRGMRELLKALGPSVLVLEDLHWADQMTLEFLHFLAPDPPSGLALVCTYRREDLRAGSPLFELQARLSAQATTARVTLSPLDQQGVRELVTAILDTEEMSDEFTQYLFERTAGLPFALEEVLLLLKQRRDLIRRQGQWVRHQLTHIGVPTELRDAILARVGRLSRAARSVVYATAVLSLPADEELLAEVASLDTIQASEAIAEAVASALLFEKADMRYTLRHALAREAIEESIPASVRRRLHAGAAGALERLQPRPVFRLAHHYKAAGKTAEWVSCAEAAADQARSSDDAVIAGSLLKDALSLENLTAATRGRLAGKLAPVAVLGLYPKDAIPIIRELCDDERLPRQVRGELRVDLGRLLVDSGEGSAAIFELIRAIDEEALRPPIAARAMVMLGATPFHTGKTIDYRYWLDRAVQAAASSDDGATKIMVAWKRAWTLFMIGDPAGWQALDNMPQPDNSFEEIQQAACGCGNVAFALLILGHYQHAAELLREGFQWYSKIEHSAAVLTGLNLELDWLTGQWAGLEQRANAYCQRMENWPTVAAEARMVVGLCRLAQGEVQDASAILAPLAEDFRGDIPVLAWLVAALGRIRLAQGANQAAFDEINRALEVVESSGNWIWATDLVPVAVEAMLRANLQTQATELTGRFAEGIMDRDAPNAAAALAWCRALIEESGGEPQRAAAAYLRNAQTWDALSRPYEAARVREAAGRCLMVKDSEHAQATLLVAMEGFQELGAAWDLRRVRHTLLQLGAIPRHRTGRKGYGDHLSPREMDVARMAAAGRSNREIATTLVISLKTVEGHMSSIMGKLSVTSRKELGAYLEEHPIPSSTIL